jgi:hypothetical protein
VTGVAYIDFYRGVHVIEFLFTEHAPRGIRVIASKSLSVIPFEILKKLPSKGIFWMIGFRAGKSYVRHPKRIRIALVTVPLNYRGRKPEMIDAALLKSVLIPAVRRKYIICVPEGMSTYPFFSLVSGIQTPIEV